MPPGSAWRAIGVVAGAAAAVTVGSLSVPPQLQQPAAALPLAIGLGALGATATFRWDTGWAAGRCA